MEKRYYISKNNGICTTFPKNDISFEEAENYLFGLGCKKHQAGEYVWYKNDNERDEYGQNPTYEIKIRKIKKDNENCDPVSEDEFAQILNSIQDGYYLKELRPADPGLLVVLSKDGERGNEIKMVFNEYDRSKTYYWITGNEIITVCEALQSGYVVDAFEADSEAMSIELLKKNKHGKVTDNIILNFQVVDPESEDNLH